MRFFVAGEQELVSLADEFAEAFGRLASADDFERQRECEKLEEIDVAAQRHRAALRALAFRTEDVLDLAVSRHPIAVRRLR